MPKDEHLIGVFITINTFLTEKTTLGKDIAFIALRPTPGITKSPYNSKNMPRIIIGFKDSATKAAVIDIIKNITKHIISIYVEQGDPNYLDEYGLGIQPRYSKKINNLMYIAYGSADYKDGAVYKKPVTKSWWQYLISGPSNEDMAFSEKNKAITSVEVIPAFIPFSE